MTGWRIGYLIANKMLIDNVTKLNQITINNIPVFIQDAALKGLELHKQIASAIKDKYKQRANLASTNLRSRLQIHKTRRTILCVSQNSKA